MKVWQYAMLAAFAFIAWYEFRTPKGQTVVVPDNPLGLPTAPPNPSVGGNSSLLNGTQQGTGLFQNPSGLGTTLEALQNHTDISNLGLETDMRQLIGYDSKGNALYSGG